MGNTVFKKHSLSSSCCVSTTAWLHHLNFYETRGGKA